MRFESKHVYFKQLSQKIKNFKNLPKSLTSRYLSKEYAESIQLDNDLNDPLKLLFKENVQLGRAKFITDQAVEQNAIRDIQRFYEIDPSKAVENIYSCNSATINSKYYAIGKNSYVACGLTPNGLPEFGLITKIWYLH